MSLAPLPKTIDEVRSWTWPNYAPYYDELASRTLTPENLRSYLTDWTSLSDILQELEARLMTATTLNTADEASEQALLTYAKEIAEPRKTAEHTLKEKLLSSGLSVPTIVSQLNILQGQAKVFREANLSRETQLVELGNEFDKLVGSQSVEWEGKTLPLSMLNPLLQDMDRAKRESVWRAKYGRVLEDRESYNDLWKRMYAIRKEIAAEAGVPSYREYMWAQMGRVDYTPADVAQFRETIRTVVVPAAERIAARRKARLGLDSMRPWDADAAPYGNTPLKPFDSEEVLLDKSEAVFAELDPQLDAWFKEMRAEDLMDLYARPNKANGGYCTDYPLAKRPFIFMNAAGTHGDLQTLFHEAGHCFHAYEGFKHEITFERQPPMEFCEVASMGMEMLCQPFLESFYTKSEAARAQIEHIEKCLLFLPYMAVVDGFQDWAYTNPEGADPAACDAKWLELWRQFMTSDDYSGLEEIEMTGWHRKLHIFQVPFYYVEYGLAQIGAFQVWANSRRNLSEAVVAYRKGLELGSTTGLPNLFAAVGGKFAFDSETLGSLVADAESQVDALLAAIE